MPKIEFEKLTKAEQRVVIAKDLILRLRDKRFTPRTNAYLVVSRFAGAERDARKALKNAECRACQIGGMFLCALDRHNKLSTSDLGLYRAPRNSHASDLAMREYLERWFSQPQLYAVEQYFEGWSDGYAFAEMIPEPRQRMRMIAQNIVDGNGRFSAKRLMETARGMKKAA